MLVYKIWRTKNKNRSNVSELASSARIRNDTFMLLLLCIMIWVYVYLIPSHIHEQYLIYLYFKQR